MRQLFKNAVKKRLEDYAARLIETHRPTTVAVTGSVGKTSTKLAIHHLLKSKYRVLVHEGNYNTEFGLPLSLFGLEAPDRPADVRAWFKLLAAMRRQLKDDYPYDIVVLEMGADRPGDIKNFMRYIEPDIGVVTAVAKVHIEEFKTAAAVMEEKWSLASGSREVFYNHDDGRLRKAAVTLEKAAGYGLEPADNWAELHGFQGGEGWKASLHLEGETLDVQLPVVARHSVYPLVVAAAVAKRLDVDNENIVEGLAGWPQPAGRMKLLQGKNDSLILDDTYNASPYATVAALDALDYFQGRKLAILGTMNELGDYETAGHRLVGKHAGDLDLLVTIGEPAADYMVPAAVDSGLSPKKIASFTSPYDAGQYVAERLQPGDTVLAKGSQNAVFAEEAVKQMLADPSEAAGLVRQSPQWLEKKHSQFSETAM